MTTTRYIYKSKTDRTAKNISTKNANKLNQKDLKLNRQDKQKLKKISTGEKLLCCSSYFTFGLCGLLYILFNFCTTNATSKFTILHTLQALIFGVFTAVSIFTIKALNIFCLTILPSFTINSGIESNILPYLNIMLFCMAGLLSLTSFSKRFLILPGIKNIAKQIIN